jgi:hypothetical protein
MKRIYRTLLPPLRVIAWLFLFFCLCWVIALVASRDDPVVRDQAMQYSESNVSDTQNGWLYLKKAESVLSPAPPKFDDDLKKFENFLDSNDTATKTALADLLKKNEEAFQLTEKADQCARYQGPKINTFADGLYNHNGTVRLARLRTFRAYHLFRQDRETQALDEGFKVVMMGRRLENSDGGLITLTVGVAIQDIGLEAIQQMIAKTTLKDTVLKPYLKSNEPYTVDLEGAGNAIRIEYRMLANSMDDIFQSLLKKAPLHSGKILTPAFKKNRTISSLAENYQELIENFRLPLAQQRFPKIEAKQKSYFEMIFSTNPVGNILAQAGAYGSKRYCANLCIAKNRGAATRTLLALKCYKLRHGELPETLNALVPEYLDQVPLDDFSGEALHYSKTEKKLWSVGMNLTDEGGKKPIPPEDMFNEIVFDINF